MFSDDDIKKYMRDIDAQFSEDLKNDDKEEFTVDIYLAPHEIIEVLSIMECVKSAAPIRMVEDVLTAVIHNTIRGISNSPVMCKLTIDLADCSMVLYCLNLYKEFLTEEGNAELLAAFKPVINLFYYAYAAKTGCELSVNKA